MAQPDKRTTTAAALLPFHAELHQETSFYREAFEPPHSPLTVKRIADGILATNAEAFPYFGDEVRSLQTQLRHLMYPQSTTGIVAMTSSDEIAALIRKNAGHDPGRQFMLETLVAPQVGIPLYPQLPLAITPDLLAYYHVLRHRETQGLRRTSHSIPYKAEAVVAINAMEDALLTLPKRTFASRLDYMHQAIQAIGSVLLEPSQMQAVNEDLYAQVKGAVSGAALRTVIQKHLPRQTEMHSPLVELDMLHAIDGIGIHLPADTIVFTGQYKSSSHELPTGTPLTVRRASSTAGIDLSAGVKRMNYRSDHEMPAYIIPILMAHPTPTGPIIKLAKIGSYDAAFDAAGRWTNRMHVSWDKLKATASHRFVEETYQLWQGLSGPYPTHVNGMTAIFGVVNYHDLEEWHQANKHTIGEQERHLVEAFYAFGEDLRK